MAATLGTTNPLRYRGYVYDTEYELYYLQSRYYDPEIGRFLNADAFASTGQGFVGNNMFAYCGNNPVLYLDSNGKRFILPPMIENGLNLPATGGKPVIINGITYQYAIEIKNGELYEYWFNESGDLVWARHHSDHRTPQKHSNPHDHKGSKDKNGNNTIIKGPLPVDKNFNSPQKSQNNQTVEQVVTGLAASIVAYQLVKWALATFLAPLTGGVSYGVAAVTP